MEIKRTQSYYGFTDNDLPMRAARKRDQLDKGFKFEGKDYRFADFAIYALIEGGYYTDTEIITHGWVNTRWGKDWGELKRPRTEYHFVCPDDKTYYKLNKTQYDYCNYILEKFESAVEAEKWVSDENIRIAAEKERIEREAEEEREREKAERKARIELQEWMHFECMKYVDTPIMDKCNEIFKRVYPDLPQAINYSNVLSVVSAQNILNERVRAELITRLHNDNKGSIRVFEWYTGVKLPRNYKDRIKVLEKITPDDYVKAI